MATELPNAATRVLYKFVVPSLSITCFLSYYTCILYRLSVVLTYTLCVLLSICSPQIIFRWCMELKRLISIFATSGKVAHSQTIPCMMMLLNFWNTAPMTFVLNINDELLMVIGQHSRPDGDLKRINILCVYYYHRLYISKKFLSSAYWMCSYSSQVMYASFPLPQSKTYESFAIVYDLA